MTKLSEHYWFPWKRKVASQLPPKEGRICLRHFSFARGKSWESVPELGVPFPCSLNIAELFEFPL